MRQSRHIGMLIRFLAIIAVAGAAFAYSAGARAHGTAVSATAHGVETLAPDSGFAEDTGYAGHDAERHCHGAGMSCTSEGTVQSGGSPRPRGFPVALPLSDPGLPKDRHVIPPRKPPKRPT